MCVLKMYPSSWKVVKLTSTRFITSRLKNFSDNRCFFQEMINWWIDHAWKARIHPKIFTKTFCNGTYESVRNYVRRSTNSTAFRNYCIFENNPSFVGMIQSLYRQKSDNRKIKCQCCLPYSCRIATIYVSNSPVFHYEQTYICRTVSCMPLRQIRENWGEDERTSTWKWSVPCFTIWRMATRMELDARLLKLQVFMTPCWKFLRLWTISSARGSRNCFQEGQQVSPSFLFFLLWHS